MSEYPKSLAELDLNRLYSYADYLVWQFNERVELLKGHLRKMSAPSVQHQYISMQLGTSMNLYFRQGRCRVFNSPL